MIDSSTITAIRHCGCLNVFHISWKMTDWCNYSCPYCITGRSGEAIVPQATIEKRAEQINKIISKVSLLKKITLLLVGGEVAYYDLRSVLSKLSLHRVSLVSLITNFSNTVDYYAELAEFLAQHKIKLNILASYHEQFGTPDEFLQKLLELKQRNSEISLTCGLCYSNDNIDKNFIRQLLDSGIKLNLAKERDLNNVNTSFSDENETYLRNIEIEDRAVHGNATNVQILTTDGATHNYSSTVAASNDIADGGFSPIGYRCSAGVSTIRILPNGDVCRAGCNYLQTRGVLGNLDAEDEITLPKKWVLCKLSPERKCQFCYKVNIEKNEE